MQMNNEIPKYAIGRLSFQPGDVLVVKYNNYGPITAEQVARVKGIINREAGNIPVIVLGSDVDLAVLTKGEIEQRSERSANV